MDKIIGEIIEGLHDLEAIKFGEFTLSSGQKSALYVDLRLLVSAPALLSKVASAFARVLLELKFDRLAGVPYGGLPIGTAIALEMKRPLIYPRKEVKEHGTRKIIEGNFKPGERIILVDDLITSGGSLIKDVQPIREAGLIVEEAVVIIDRQQGGREALARNGLLLHSLCTISEVAAHLREGGRINDDVYKKVVSMVTQA